jgi:hypothetical protein
MDPRLDRANLSILVKDSTEEISNISDRDFWVRESVQFE